MIVTVQNGFVGSKVGISWFWCEYNLILLERVLLNLDFSLLDVVPLPGNQVQDSDFASLIHA